MCVACLLSLAPRRDIGAIAVTAVGPRARTDHAPTHAPAAPPASIAAAIGALKPALANAMKTNAAANAMLDSVLNDMRALYPASGELAGSLASLCGRNEAITSHAAIDEARAAVDDSVAKVEEKVKQVAKLVEERATLRAEVTHYNKKLESISVDATDPVVVKRVEENKIKLKTTESKFAEACDLAAPMLASLDADLAALTGEPFRGFLAASRDASASLVSELQQGLAGVPAPQAPAA